MITLLQMMVGFFNLVYDPRISPKDLLPEKKLLRTPRLQSRIIDAEG